VRRISAGEAEVSRLAVNRDFRDDRERRQEQGGGVERDDEEVAIAERALSERFLEELGALPSLREWLAAEKMERGLGPLAKELAGPRPPEARTRKQWKAYQRELRALERPAAAPGRQRHESLSRERQQRIREVMQERPHPYADVRRVRSQRLRSIDLALGVRGDWRFSEDLREYKLYHTERTNHPSREHTSIDRHGRGFVAAVEDYIGRFTPAYAFELERVYSIEIQ